MTYSLNRDQLGIIHQAMNEVLNGLRVENFEERIGSRILVEDELEKTYDLLKLGHERYSLPINAQQLKIYSHAMEVVCEEIEDWEFQTRMGVEKYEVDKLLKFFNEAD